MLNEINDQAGQHEVIAENLSTAVVSDLSILVKSMRDDRRKVSSHVIRHQPHWVTQSLSFPLPTEMRGKNRFECVGQFVESVSSHCPKTTDNSVVNTQTFPLLT